MKTEELSDFVNLEINASARKCYDIMIDFESYPAWQKAVDESKILQTHKAGQVVEFKADLVFKTFRYVLNYRFNPDKHRFDWDLLEGDIPSITGFFNIERINGSNKCLATYSLNINPGFWVPQSLVHFSKKFVMLGVLKDLKKIVE